MLISFLPTRNIIRDRSTREHAKIMVKKKRCGECFDITHTHTHRKPSVFTNFNAQINKTNARNVLEHNRDSTCLFKSK